MVQVKRSFFAKLIPLESKASPILPMLVSWESLSMESLSSTFSIITDLLIVAGPMSVWS